MDDSNDVHDNPDHNTDDPHVIEDDINYGSDNIPNRCQFEFILWVVTIGSRVLVIFVKYKLQMGASIPRLLPYEPPLPSQKGALLRLPLIIVMKCAILRNLMNPENIFSV